MADNTELKNAIAKIIKTNGNQEITGQVLQNTLNNIISSIGSNATFAGIAIPITSPGTPDQNVFYFAVQAGTYVNFGGLVIKGGFNIIKNNTSGNWVLSNVYELVDKLGDSETAVISQKAVTTELAQLRFQLRLDLNEIEQEQIQGGVYDVSSHNDGAVFESLSALLGSANLSTLIPTSVRHGGMSIRFIQGSDNKYVQFRYMSSSTAVADFTNTANWQGVDDEPTAGSDNLIESGGVYKITNDIKFSTIPLKTLIEKTIGEGQNFGFILSEDIRIKCTISGNDLSDNVKVFPIAESGTILSAIIETSVNVSTVYTVPSGGIKGFRITNNAHSDVTLIIEKVLCEDELSNRIEQTNNNLEKAIYSKDINIFNLSSPTNANRYYNANKVWSINVNGINHYAIDISSYKGQKIRIQYINSAINVTGSYYAWVFDNDERTFSFMENVGEYIVSFNQINVIDDIVTVPETATYLRIFSTSSNGQGIGICPLKSPSDTFPELNSFVDGTLLKSVTVSESARNIAAYFRKGSIIKIDIKNVSTSDNVKLFPRNKDGVGVNTILNLSGTTSGSVTYECPVDIYSFRLAGNNSLSDIKTDFYYQSVFDRFVGIEDNVDFLNHVTKSAYIAIDDYYDSVCSHHVGAIVNGNTIKENIVNGILTDITKDNFVHDSNVIVVDGYAYIVFISTTTGGGDNAGNPSCKVYLRKYNLNDIADYTELLVAGSGVDIITGGAGEPNIIKDESNADKLHIVFTANATGYTIMTCDYSIANNALSNYREVIISNSDGDTGNCRYQDIDELFGTEFSQFESLFLNQQANSDIGYYNGYYYIGLCVGGVTPNPDDKTAIGVIFKTADFTNWQFFASINSLGVYPCCELAVYCDSNYIYSALRPTSPDNIGSNATYGVIAKWNYSKRLIDYKYYRNCGTKPSFLSIENDLYLCSNSYSRGYCEFILIDKNELSASKLIGQFSGNMSYTSFSKDSNSNIIMSGRISGVTGIGLSRFIFPQLMTESEIENKIITFFTT